MLGPRGATPMPPSRGAYGMTVDSGIPSEMLVLAPPTWPSWALRVCRGSELPSEFDPLDEDLVLLAVQPRGAAVSSRSRGTTTIVVPDHSSHALVHPYLASAAVGTSPWLGRTSFHGGSFLLNGEVWGVLADREGGKSSTMAWLALRGYPIFSDDLIVVDELRAFAGPRILDLRRSAAEHFGVGESIGLVGTRERWRMTVKDVVAEAPIGGWIYLSWSSKPSLQWLPTEERALLLRDHKALHSLELDPLLWLNLLAKPMLSFGRPRNWPSMDGSMELLMEYLLKPGHGEHPDGAVIPAGTNLKRGAPRSGSK